MTSAAATTPTPPPRLVLTAPATPLAEVLRRGAQARGLQVDALSAHPADRDDLLTRAHALRLAPQDVLIHELGGDPHAPLVLLAEALARRAHRLGLNLVLVVPIDPRLDTEQSRRVALAEAIALRCCPRALPLRLPLRGATSQEAALAPLWPLLGATSAPLPDTAEAGMAPAPATAVRSAADLLKDALRQAEAAFEAPDSRPAERLRDAIEQVGWGERIATRLAMLARRRPRPDAPETGPAPLGPR